MENQEKLKATNLSVNYFSGANTNDMKHYTKPSTKKNPNSEVVLIHNDTNELSSNFAPADIVTNIINLVADGKGNFDRSCDTFVDLPSLTVLP